MNYEKLDPTRFATNLKEGKYAGLTGARRAIGKTSWTDKEKDTARAAADKHFVAESGSTSAPKAAKVAKRAAKRAAKKTAKVAKRAAKAAAVETVEEPRQKRKYTRRQPQTATDTVVDTTPASSREYKVAQNLSDDPAVVRQYAAAKVIETYKTAGQLTAAEQTALDYANFEYTGNASEYATNKVLGTMSLHPVTGAVTRQPKAAKKAAKAEVLDDSEDNEVPAAKVVEVGPATVTAPASARIIVPPADDDPAVLSFTPEERAQHERLKIAATAAANLRSITVPQPQA